MWEHAPALEPEPALPHGEAGPDVGACGQVVHMIQCTDSNADRRRRRRILCCSIVTSFTMSATSTRRRW
ncbi:hypothetical protein VDGL01_06135 [Verticillium dahliae]